MKSILLIAGLCLLCGCRGTHRPLDHGVPMVEPKREPPRPSPPVEQSAAVTLRSSEEDPGTAVLPETPSRSIETAIVALNGQLEDAFFPYDRSIVTPEALSALKRDAHLLGPLLSDFPQVRVVVEGHCDERGSAEYNLGLGDHRAARTAEVLRAFGVPAARIDIISFGKESPQCMEANEACWRRNRRAHIVLHQRRSGPS